MIGNDIVDLNQAAIDSNWHRPGYLEKIFTEEEQCMITGSDKAELFVWLFWSMKEAAYKIYSRQTNTRSFAPRKIKCTLTSFRPTDASGIAVYDGYLFFTKSTITDEYVHSVAAPRQKRLQQIHYSISTNYNDYRARNPSCVSHHGKFVALVFDQS